MILGWIASLMVADMLLEGGYQAWAASSGVAVSACVRPITTVAVAGVTRTDATVASPGGPDGSLAHYDKRHLFRMAGEHNHYTPGERQVQFELKGWRIRPLICYDLRFPVWSRNRGDYDVLLYVANWPARRREHWRTLLVARAIENQCYVVAPAQGGYHVNGRETHGHSMIVDPWGRVMDHLPRGSGVVIADVNPSYQASLRASLPALLHRTLTQI